MRNFCSPLSTITCSGGMAEVTFEVCSLSAARGVHYLSPASYVKLTWHIFLKMFTLTVLEKKILSSLNSLCPFQSPSLSGQYKKLRNWNISNNNRKVTVLSTYFSPVAKKTAETKTQGNPQRPLCVLHSEWLSFPDVVCYQGLKIDGSANTA